MRSSTLIRFVACGLVAAAAAGCVTDDEVSDISQESTGALGADPNEIRLGTFAVNTPVSGTVALVNHGRTDLIITDIRVFPPDPCLTGYVCFPPDPCQIDLLVPCVRPGERADLTVTCTAPTSGLVALVADVNYGDGSSHSTLSVPITGTAR